MASEKVSWLFELLDKVSAPSAGVISSLDKLEKRLTDIEKHPGATEKAGKGIASLEKQTRSLTSTLASAGEKVASFAAQTTLAFGALALAGAASLAGAGAKYALEASNFKQDTILALESIEGSAEKAQKTYDLINNMASSAGNKNSIAEAMIKLKGAGFGDSRAQDLVAASLDVAARNGKEGEAKQKAFLEEVTKINSKNKFDTGAADAIAQASGGSIRTTDLLKAIGAQRKIDVSTEAGMSAVKAILDIGQVKQAEGLNAVLSVVNSRLNSGKGLGTSALVKATDTISGQVSKLKAGLSTIFEDVNTSPLISALGKVSELFNANSAQGARFKGFLNGAFESVGKMLSSVLTVENIERFATGAISFLSGVWTAIVALKDGFVASFAPIWEALKKTFGGETQDSAAKLTSIFGALGKVLGVVAGAVAWVIAGVGALAYFLVWLYDKTVAWGKTIDWAKTALYALGAVAVVAFGAILVPIAAVSAAIYGIYKAIEWIVSKIGSALQSVGDTFSSVFEPIQKVLKTLVEGIASAYASLKDLMKGGVTGAIGGIKDKVVDGVGSAFNAVKGVFSKSEKKQAFEDVGGEMIEGLLNGVTMKQAKVDQAFENMALGAEKSVKDKLEIRSPSRVFYRLGTQTIEGFTRAVNDNAETANVAIQHVVAPNTEQAQTQTQGARNFSPTINVVINTSNAEVAQDLKSTIEIQLAQLFEEMELRAS